MARKAKGNYARMNMEVIRRAEMLQARAVDYIDEQFRADETLPPNPLRFDDFVKMLEEADRTGTREELEAQLAEILLPIIEQALAQPQQAPQEA